MKEKFIKGTIILIIGGLITKILGMVIRIITTRIIGLEGIGLYTLIMPTFNLFITIATLSLPIAISKLISENLTNNKKIVFGTIPIIIIFNTIVIIILTLLAKPIATYLLKNASLTLPIMATGLTLPFITLSGIARGYFFGKQKMLPHITSNIIEQIVRLLATFIFIPKLLEHSVIYAVTGLVLINIISELASIFILFLFLPNKITIKKEYFKFEYDNFKNIAKISIPNTLSRLISSIGMFLEPIIITFVLTYIGYKNNYITTEYGTISGYVIPMVTLPSFLSGAISSALLPVLTRYKVLNDKNNLKKKLLQGILFSLLIGIPFTIILFFFPKLSLKLIFKTTTGANYLKLAAPLFLISYIAAPLNTCLQAIDKSNTIMFTTIISILVKTILLITLTFLNIGMIPIIISTFVASLLSTIYQIRVIKKYLKDKYKEI